VRPVAYRRGNEKVGLHPVWEKAQNVDGTFADFCQYSEELKKGNEEDTADGYEDEVQDEDLAE